MTDEPEIDADELDWEAAAVHEPLGVMLIRATETLAQDRDRWKTQAEQLQAQLEAALVARDDARANALVQATIETQKMWREQKERAERAEAALEVINRSVDEDEIVKLAEVRGLAFALDHVGYDGLGNIAIKLERRVYDAEALLREIRDLIPLNADGTADSYDGTQNPVILAKASAPFERIK